MAPIVSAPSVAAVAQLRQTGGAAAPARHHLHKQLEIHRPAEHLLHLQACPCTDRAQHAVFRRRLEVRPRDGDVHALTHGNPDSAGVPAAFTQHTIVLPYNDVDAVKAAFAANPGQIAGIIVEPVPGNAGLYLPRPGYLEFLSQITKQDGALLIFDEVMTGFRLALGGAQQRFGITPDLSCFGKIIGGGLPVGAFGGLADIMDCLAPLGPVYQAGTLSGNPLAMAAGIANLEELQTGGAYCKLEELGQQLEEGMKSAAKAANIPLTVNNCGSMFCGYFTSDPVWNLADAMKSDRERFKKFFHGMLNEGVYLAPSQFESGFISVAHSTTDIDTTVKAAAKVMKTL